MRYTRKLCGTSLALYSSLLKTTRVYFFIFLCIYLFIHFLFIYLFIYLFMYVFIYIYIYVYIYIYIYIFQYIRHWRMQYDQSPLHCAVIGRHDAIVALLLDRNADIDVKDYVRLFGIWHYTIPSFKNSVVLSAVGLPPHPLCTRYINEPREVTTGPKRRHRQQGQCEQAHVVYVHPR